MDITQYTPPTIPAIVTQEDLQGATVLLSELNRKLDTLKEEKEKVTKPLNEALKQERARFKPYEEALQGAVDQIKDAMKSFIAKEEEAKAKALIDLRAGNTTATEAIATIAENNTQGAKTTQGAVSFVEVKAFRIIDITKVPHDYLLPNETMIRQAMKEGKPIAGVEYYTEKQIRNRR